MVYLPDKRESNPDLADFIGFDPSTMVLEESEVAARLGVGLRGRSGCKVGAGPDDVGLRGSEC